MSASDQRVIREFIWPAAVARNAESCAMRIELRVHRNGQTIFRAECDTERGSSFAEFSKLALREFNQRHPEVSLLDDDVWLKFDTVRCPEAPKTDSP